MKIFLIILAIGAGVYYWQQHHDATPTTVPTSEKTPTAPAVAVAPRPVYEHDWARHSLDRTHEVMDQVAKTRKQNGQP